VLDVVAVAAVVDVLLLDEVHRGLLGARGAARDAGVDGEAVGPAGLDGVVVLDEPSRAELLALGPRPRLPDLGLLLADALVDRLAVRLLPRRLAVVVRPRALGHGVA